LVFTYHTFYERYAHCLRMDAARAQRMVIDMTIQFCKCSHLVLREVWQQPAGWHWYSWTLCPSCLIH
jgi:hypothetical protein